MQISRWPMMMHKTPAYLLDDALQINASLPVFSGSITDGQRRIAGIISELAVARVLQQLGIPARRVNAQDHWSEHDILINRPHHRLEVKATTQTSKVVLAHYQVNINYRTLLNFSPLQCTDLYAFTRTSTTGDYIAVLGWDTIERVAAYGLPGSPWERHAAGYRVGSGTPLAMDCLSCNVDKLNSFSQLPGFLACAGSRAGYDHAANLSLCSRNLWS